MHAELPTFLKTGTLINARYRILSKLGQGSTGAVYLAEHTQLKTLLALKAVTPSPDANGSIEKALEQCRLEGEILMPLNHPHLPRVFDAFVEQGRFFLVMEYIPGVSLSQQLRFSGEEFLEVADVVNWGIQLAQVLAYLHDQSPAIIFRDIKPANVMLQPDGNIRLIDFGIARRCFGKEQTSVEQVGSIGYSPPEQYRPQPLDPRADNYALGATLHHLITGRLPAERPFVFPPAHTLNAKVPPALSELLDWCLAVEPSARPQSMEQIQNELEAIRDMMHANTLTQKLPPLEVPPSAPRVRKGFFGFSWRSPFVRSVPSHSRTQGAFL